MTILGEFLPCDGPRAGGCPWTDFGQRLPRELQAETPRNGT